MAFFDLIEKGIRKSENNYERIIGRYWPTDASMQLPSGEIIGSCIRSYGTS